MVDGSLGAYASVPVGVAAGLLLTGRAQRTALMVQNLGTGTVYLGSDLNVTSANGIQLLPGASMVIPTRGPTFAISTSASTDVRYWEIF